MKTLSLNDRNFLLKFLTKEESKMLLEVFDLGFDDRGVIEYSLDEINERLRLNRIELNGLNFSVLEKVNSNENFGYQIKKRPMTNFYVLSEVEGVKVGKTIDKKETIEENEKTEEVLHKINLLYNKVLEHEQKIKDLEYEVFFLKSLQDKSLGK